MPLTPFEMLAGGGLAATLAAAWGQIRSTFNYVRSQILVRTNMDSGTRRRVLLHLARTAKRTPGGDQYVFAHWFHPSSGAVSLPELSLDSRRVSTENLFEGAVFELELLSGCSLALRGGHEET